MNEQQLIELIKKADLEENSETKTALLNEIDILFWLFISPKYRKIEDEKRYQYEVDDGWLFSDGWYETTLPVPKVTRSRDQLKNYRSDKWRVKDAFQTDSGWDYCYALWDNPKEVVFTEDYESETLAELVCVIKSIAYDRKKENERL